MVQIALQYYTHSTIRFLDTKNTDWCLKLALESANCNNSDCFKLKTFILLYFRSYASKDGANRGKSGGCHPNWLCDGSFRHLRTSRVLVL